MFSLELIPDAATDAAVRAEWDRLVAADLPSAGRHSGPSNRPYVTLAVRDHMDAGALQPLAAMMPVPLELGGVLVFGRGDRFVLSRAVVMTRQLLDLHRAAASAVGGGNGTYANTEPDRWSPHITLARRLDANALRRALGVLELSPVSGAAQALRVWDATEKRVTAIE